MLARFESRAATYDRENRFFDQDFEDLRPPDTSGFPYRLSWEAQASRWRKWPANSGASPITRRLQLWL